MHQAPPQRPNGLSLLVAPPEQSAPALLGLAVQSVLRTFALVWELFLRRRFGVRYYRLISIFPTLGGFWVVYGALGEGLFEFRRGWLYSLFGYSFTFVAVLRGFTTRLRSYRGVTEASGYAGEPLFFFFWLGPLNRVIPLEFEEAVIKRLWEPLFAAGLSYLVMQIDRSLGAFLLFCAAVWAVKNNRECNQFFSNAMNSSDARFVGEQAREAERQARAGRQPSPRRNVPQKPRSAAEPRSARSRPSSPFRNREAPAAMGLIDHVPRGASPSTQDGEGEIDWSEEVEVRPVRRKPGGAKHARPRRGAEPARDDIDWDEEIEWPGREAK